ncbi:MAG: hypothetical protein DI556_10060 [Rhodovulum sulfidophilum]|uniref:Alginate lyase domain-containing protein n=1 Tax=Rhodovulum sulfidophilum TaxID=35806 RepID=A0A2W5Q517_RHOSU|nr:MAG: hypothetical protein DI556_10060 [Rhodovulum sulfidophilum]
MFGFEITRARRRAGRTGPSGRSAARAGGLVLAILLTATGVAAQTAPDAAMPKSVKRFTDTRADCFLTGEKQDYDAWIDQFRITVPGCDKGMIPPQKTLQSFRVYKQGSNRVIDCSTLRQKEFGTRFLDTYLADVVAETDAARKSPAAASCAANMLYAWAKADAITEIGDQGNENQSQAMIGWTFGGLSAAYYIHPEVRAAAKAVRAADGTADDVIRAWFQKLAGPVSAMIDRDRAAKNEDNIQYWRAFAILPTAFLNADAELMAQSRAVFDSALAQVTMNQKNPANDGYLPLEMERGPRALHYQTYAAQPILGIALLSESEGCGFLASGAQTERLTMLMSRVFEARSDPKLVSAQVARYAKNGKPVEQLRTGTVGGAPRLMYLVNAIDPALYTAVDDNLAATTGEPSPVIRARAGRDAGQDRMGGAYSALAAAAKVPGPPPAAIASVCRSDG